MTSVSLSAPAAAAPARSAGGLTPWRMWGFALIAPYLAVFVFLVVYPVLYAFWLAHDPQSYVRLADDPVFARSVVNTLLFLAIAINLKMVVALGLSGFFLVERAWIKGLMVLFILPWAVPSIPTILSVRFMLNPEWGVINQTIFRWTFEDGPNWLNSPPLALFFAMLVHIWKSLPFWTLILISGRLAIPGDQYEAAAVDGATRFQKFQFVTWPSIRQLYLTCAILSTIWTLGDFNSVYLLTGGGPADLTHVLATLGIRYLKLGEVDLSVATIVCALPLILPLVYFMMKRLSK